jgi:glyoxylase-like metal-dependent hydrolase (beta-lactamase superfamily II)
VLYRLSHAVSVVLYPGLVSSVDSVSALIRCGEGYVLVDSGSGLPQSNSALLRNLVEAGVAPGSLRFLVNTHSHVNNAGGDYWVRGLMAPVLVAHVPDSRAIETGDPALTAAEELGLAFKPVPVSLELAADSWEIPGCEDLGATVIHTPGHTPGSVSVYLEDRDGRILLVGDALGSLSARWGSSEREWLESLEKIRSLEPDVLCTSALCMKGREAVDFIRAVESKGPVWVGR